MKAMDVMTRDVVTIEADRPVVEVARLLLDRRISAVPVVDPAGRLLGIVSEGDLLRRVETDTQRRRSGWHALMTSNWNLAAEYVKSHARRAADIMTRDVVSVSENTPLGDITDIFEERKIKRVPVTRDGKIVGIVSRADLLRALVAATRDESAPSGGDDAIQAELIGELRRQRWARSTGVCIEVKDGVVRLSGTVPPTDTERTALRIAAERIAGVRTVEDALAPAVARPGM